MTVYELHREQVVRAPLTRVFAFFERPENLEILTPPWLRMQIVTPSPIPMQVGAVIDYGMRLRGIPVHWRTLITEHTPPMRFVDVQIKGPYRLWHHAHSFEETSDGTRLIDDVTYALPFGFLGTLAHRWIVHHELERIFDFRAKAIEHEFDDA